MARHWASYAGQGLTDKQVRALDLMAAEHGFSDGLALIAEANGLSRSKANKQMSEDRHKARQMLDAAFANYGRGGAKR